MIIFRFRNCLYLIENLLGRTCRIRNTHVLTRIDWVFINEDCNVPAGFNSAYSAKDHFPLKMEATTTIRKP
jgi:hypothetical protein